MKTDPVTYKDIPMTSEEIRDEIAHRFDPPLGGSSFPDPPRLRKKELLEWIEMINLNLLELEKKVAHINYSTAYAGWQKQQTNAPQDRIATGIKNSHRCEIAMRLKAAADQIEKSIAGSEWKERAQLVRNAALEMETLVRENWDLIERVGRNAP